MLRRWWPVVLIVGLFLSTFLLFIAVISGQSPVGKSLPVKAQAQMLVPVLGANQKIALVGVAMVEQQTSAQTALSPNAGLSCLFVTEQGGVAVLGGRCPR